MNMSANRASVKNKRVKERDIGFAPRAAGYVPPPKPLSREQVAVAQEVKSVDHIQAWLSDAAAGDILTYASHGHVLPERALPSVHYVRGLIAEDVVSHAQVRQGDGTIHWNIRKKIGFQKAQILDAELERFYQYLCSIARAGEKLPGVKDMAAQSHVKAGDVLRQLSALERCGAIRVSEYQRGDAMWRVVRIMELDVVSAKPPVNWKG